MNKSFRALADPTRREILKLLQERDLTAGEIAEAFDWTKATISHHLNALADAGLVRVRRDAQQRIYSRNETVIQEVLQEIMTLLRVGESNDDHERDQ